MKERHAFKLDYPTGDHDTILGRLWGRYFLKKVNVTDGAVLKLNGGLAGRSTQILTRFERNLTESSGSVGREHKTL
ncbi:MAG: hypothetical protein AAGC47_16500 [Bacteroidota bacterium]